jgi:hypothetical protein
VDALENSSWPVKPGGQSSTTRPELERLQQRLSQVPEGWARLTDGKQLFLSNVGGFGVLLRVTRLGVIDGARESLCGTRILEASAAATSVGEPGLG